MKSLLFWLCLGINVATCAMEHCIPGPARGYSFYYCSDYCPANYSISNASSQAMDDVISEYQANIIFGATAAVFGVTVGTLAGGLSVARKRLKYVIGTACIAGMTGFLFGTGMLVAYNADPSKCQSHVPYSTPERMMWATLCGTTVMGLHVGTAMLNALRDV